MTTEHRIDALLEAWAAEQRLGPEDADAILRSIVGEPSEALAPTWWSGLSAQVTSAVLLAASPPGAPELAVA
jgi:hypothetical protein